MLKCMEACDYMGQLSRQPLRGGDMLELPVEGCTLLSLPRFTVRIQISRH